MREEKRRKEGRRRRRRRRRRRKFVIHKILRGSIIMCKTKDLYTLHFLLTIYTETLVIYMYYNTPQKMRFIAWWKKSYFKNRAL